MASEATSWTQRRVSRSTVYCSPSGRAQKATVSLNDIQRPPQDPVDQLAVEQVAFPQGEQCVALTETGFIGAARDPFDRAGRFGGGDRLVAEEGGFFHDGEAHAIGGTFIAHG